MLQHDTRNDIGLYRKGSSAGQTREDLLKERDLLRVVEGS